MIFQAGRHNRRRHRRRPPYNDAFTRANQASATSKKHLARRQNNGSFYFQ